MVRNQALVPIIKSLSEPLHAGSTRYDLQESLRAKGKSNSGSCSKADFVNSVFDTVRGLKPSDLMKLLQTFSGEYFEDLVSYTDFLSLVERQGQVGGLEYQNMQMMQR